MHRDIKPENVLLTPDDFAYLVDFGIAHGGGDPSMTTTGLIIGSCAYMSAERFSGGQVGPAADVYSLTCLLYESLTGRPPFETGDLRQLMTAHMFSPPPRPSIMRRGINRAFDDVIARGMAKTPAERFASAGELAKAATAAVSGASRRRRPRRAAVAPSPPIGHEAVLGGVRESGGHGLHAVPAARFRRREPPQRKPRFGATQVALVVATIVLFGVAVVLAMQLCLGNQDSAAPPQTSVAAPPPSVSTTTETVVAVDVGALDHYDDHHGTVDERGAPAGRVGDRCAGLRRPCGPLRRGQHASAAIRTAQSLAVVCETTPGSYYYHGERLQRRRQRAAQPTRCPNGGGFDVTNPADGARYEVRPDHLTICSNGHVDSDEPALEYGAASG